MLCHYTYLGELKESMKATQIIWGGTKTFELKWIKKNLHVLIGSSFISFTRGVKVLM